MLELRSAVIRFLKVPQSFSTGEPLQDLKPHDYRRVSMGLTVRRKTAKNLAVRRKNERILAVSRKKN